MTPDRAIKPPRLIVGAAIVNDLAAPTRVLCAQRAYPAALAGKWELPGGKVEPPETPEVALIRELAEELGARVTLGPLLPAPTPSKNWPIPGAKPRELRVYLAQFEPGETPALGPDHLALEDHGAETVEALDWLPADRPIAAALARLLQGTRQTG